MSKAASTTLILICSDLIARMDFGAAPSQSPVYCRHIEKQPGQAIGQSIEIALAAKARCGKAVWVLCEELWTQTVSVAAQAVAGLSDQELERVLGFEVESLSGLGAAESAIGFVRGPQDAGLGTFWVTQISQADCRQIQQAVQRYGGKLRGICHPAGLPLAWQPPAPGLPWQRVEVWGEFTLCLTGQPDGTVSSRFISGTPAQESWRPAIAQWLAQRQAQRQGQQVELLCASQAFGTVTLDTLPELLRLPPLEGQGLEQWMGLWATALTQDRGQIPIIKPAARVVTRGQYVGLSAAMAAVALAACIGHGYWMKHRVADIGAQTVSAQGPRQEMTRLNGQISALEVELKQLDKKRPAPVGSDSAEGLIRQKKRICALLEAMGHLVCQERVVTRVRAEDQGSVTIEGLCLMPDCADSLAVGLARELGKSGWEVRGAQKSARLTSPDGGPWEFKVMLLPSGTLPKPSPAVPVAGAPAKVSIPAGGPQ